MNLTAKKQRLTKLSLNHSIKSTEFNYKFIVLLVFTCLHRVCKEVL